MSAPAADGLLKEAQKKFHDRLAARLQLKVSHFLFYKLVRSELNLFGSDEMVLLQAEPLVDSLRASDLQAVILKQEQLLNEDIDVALNILLLEKVR